MIDEAKNVFNQLKLDILIAVVSATDTEGTLTVENDVSAQAIGADFTIDGRPMAFSPEL